MAVGIRIKFRGLGQEDFDKVNAIVDPHGDPPQGLMFHGSGPIDEGWGVIDFWESREAFDAFGPRIQKALETADVQWQGEPDIKEFPVHEHFPR